MWQRIEVKIYPNAGRNEVELAGEEYRVFVTKSPQKNQANQAMLKLLAKFLGVRQSDLEIQAGAKSRRKVIRIWRPDESDATDQK